VAFASPARGTPTTDSVRYWLPYRPGREGARRHADYVRRAAAAYPSPEWLVEEWSETSEAALRAAAAAVLAVWSGGQAMGRGARSRGRDPAGPIAPARLRTQGLVITLPDFLATLVVEAALHHLDLSVHLDRAPSTPAGALAVTRATLEGLLGGPLPAGWDDRTAALKGTGRMELDGDDRRMPASLLDRFPLLA
jgi:hypothetical protein